MVAHSLLVKFLTEIGAQEIPWRGQAEVFECESYFTELVQLICIIVTI